MKLSLTICPNSLEYRSRNNSFENEDSENELSENADSHAEVISPLSGLFISLLPLYHTGLWVWFHRVWFHYIVNCLRVETSSHHSSIQHITWAIKSTYKYFSCREMMLKSQGRTSNDTIISKSKCWQANKVWTTYLLTSITMFPPQDLC